MINEFYRNSGKRVLDVIVACIAILLLWPLFGLTAIIVRLQLGKPVIFRQQRAGRGHRTFMLFKFRTMTDERSGGELLPDAERLTPTGQFLRGTSLDELPQLWNVLLGQMSLVGPRPLLVQYLARYDSHQARRHEVRPGITGLAQVNGRNAISWQQKFDLDVEYVDTLSPWLDMKIVFMTLLRVFQRSGISQGNHATMPLFLGSEENDRSQESTD